MSTSTRRGASAPDALEDQGTERFLAGELAAAGLWGSRAVLPDALAGSGRFRVRTGATVRDNAATPGVDTNYLRYTGGDHVVLGGTTAADTLIAGIGDTGAGLAVARSLTLANGGHPEPLVLRSDEKSSYTRIAKAVFGDRVLALHPAGVHRGLVGLRQPQHLVDFGGTLRPLLAFPRHDSNVD